MVDNKKPSISLNGAEIKRLAEDALRCLEPFEVRDIVAQMQETINSKQAEIERLKKLLEGWKTEAYKVSEEKDKLYCDAVERVKTTKAEAFKEFAEAVKLEFYKEFDELIPSIMADKIDNLVKEMVGEG